MKNIATIIKYLAFVTLLSFSTAAFADNDIFRQLALSGTVISAPIEVSTRVVTITDGGFISTFTTDGYKKYERPLKNRPSGEYTVSDNGIILSVSHDHKAFSFYNPDGYFVWSVSLADEIISHPIMGYDGRIFVSTKDTLYCYGVTGSLRWKRTIPSEINSPIRTLNDGTLLCISCPPGKESVAYRITPYGDILEVITFAGEAVLTAENENGVLILFSNGTFGCCSVQGKMAVSLWASQPISNIRISNDNTDNAAILRLNDSNAAVLYPNGLFIIVNTADGTEKSRLTISGAFNKASLFFGEENIMAVTEYDSEVYFSLISMDGELVWSGMRKTNGETVYFYTSDGYLLQFTDNWVLSVSRPMKTKSDKTSTSNAIKRPYYYGSYTGNEEEQYIKDIRNGFGEIMEELQPVSNPTVYTGIDPSIFEKDLITSLRCIQNASMTGYDFSKDIGEIIINANSELYIKAALDYPLKNGYDPDAYIIKALYAFLYSSHRFSCSDIVYKRICDAVSSICRFSGAQVFQSYGSRILVKFMSSGYSTVVKDYAVTVMKSLMDLQI